MTSENKNIVQSIKSAEQKALEGVLNEVKKKITEVRQTRNVGFMALGTSESQPVMSKKTLKFNSLKLDDLLNAEKGVLYVIENEAAKSKEKEKPKK